MRCFVAVKPSKSLRAEVARIQEDLRRAGADVRWIGPEELHVTLRFFGDLDEARVSRLRASFPQIAAAQPGFSLTYAGVGEFPKVVWIGGSREADPLATAIEAAAEAEGPPRDKYGFTPHLTIGRIRSSRGETALTSAISERKSLEVGLDQVRVFSLIQSTLTPQGPVYETVEEYRLA
ncbi:MAG TPA: RNA 2',3'-cyclic phosphodiesterase [Planctomycetota bacterium]|nr:RNA 2',3'-cyclic phosphodiesterase [Planctomycetota bacterium]